MKLVASYVVFNEAELIAESIRSVKAYVDGFVFFDVAFRSNPVHATHSTDDTRAIASAAAHPLPFTYYQASEKMELDAARNLALRMSDGDMVLIIDGDETLLGERAEMAELVDEIHRGYLRDPIGVTVFSSALRYDGHAPAIDAKGYGNLPVVYTRGIQPRIVPAKGSDWRLVPNGGSYGLYRGEDLVKVRPADPRLVLINHRTRQVFDAYQNDYAWQTALLP